MMTRLNDLTGQRFTKLVITGRVPGIPKPTRWAYKCDCGKEGQTNGHNLISGASKSCGCLTRSVIGERQLTHGHKRNGKRSPTLSSWSAMWQRTTNPKAKYYKDYGAKGIKVCDRWAEFANFLEDMGEKPDGLTLERRRVEGDYEPGNCLWATWETQNNNKRGQPKWLIDGEAMTVAQLRRHWNLSAYWVQRKLIEIPLHSGVPPKWHPQSKSITEKEH